MAHRLITRFAPSPTGLLHLGHAAAALVADASGEMLLRIEDIDRSRCRPKFETAIYEDLAWLGLNWPEPVRRQSDHLAAYTAAIDRLGRLGLTYPCKCRRGDIRAAMAAPQEGVPHGPDGPVYPGTCRGRDHAAAGADDVIRLDSALAFKYLKLDTLDFVDTGAVQTMTSSEFRRQIGDIILSRRGMGTSYHLSVVVDDAAQGITLVTRGKDLFDSTWIHVLLQKLLDLPKPQYLHHDLVRDAAGRRLAKRDDARSLRQLRADGWTPADIRREVAAVIPQG